MRVFHLRPVFVALLLVGAAALPNSARAQATSGSGFVSGPLTWTPTFQLREAGVDSNVFNTAADAKEDLTAAAVGQVNSTLALGILEAATNGSLEYLYFDRYSQERGFNRRVSTHVEFPVSRLSPDVTISWERVKDRAGNEFDTRTPRTGLSLAAGIQARVGSRLEVTGTAGRQTQTFDRGFTFQGVEIAQELNRRSTLGNVTGRLTLTPLTVLSVDASFGRDDFPLKPDAATDNTRVDAGLEFAPDAIIRGRAMLGYHSMAPHRTVSNAVAANFSGVTSAVDLSYTLLDLTRFTGRFSHDSNYSISADHPYYVSTAGSLEVLQTLFGPVDLSFRAGREKLDHPSTDREGAYVEFADTLAGGPSIRMGNQAVIAVLYDNSERRSSRGEEFGYQRHRIYTTVTYGF
jgi:hypothetical protein